MRLTLTISLALAILTTAAATKAADEAGKPAAAPAAAAPTPAKIDWEKMSKKERKDYMKKTVAPAAQKLFAGFDAKKYKKITCVTCHGEGATKGTFAMPNPQLPKLPTEPAGFKALQEKKPEMMKFMGTQVKPQMAALLGMQEWTPQNTNGFGCYQCHTKEGGEPAKPAAK
jgi:mono/diheme cytochrome c family protein